MTDIYIYYEFETGEVLPVSEEIAREMCKDQSGKEKGFRVRVFPAIKVIWCDDGKTTPMKKF